MTPRQLKDYFDDLVTSFDDRGEDEDHTLMSTSQVGEQENGTFVFSNDVQVSSLTGLQLPEQGFYLTMSAKPRVIKTPLIVGEAAKLYQKLKEEVPKPTYMNALFVGGAMFMNFSKTRFRNLPFVVVTGPCDTGKTFVAKCALSVYGQQHGDGIYRSNKRTKGKTLLAPSNLPYLHDVWDDVNFGKRLSATAALLYEDDFTSTTHSACSIKTAPVVECATNVVKKIPQDHSEWSRICLIPMDEQMKVFLSRGLIKQLSSASRSIGEIIRLKNAINEEAVNGIVEEILPLLPKTYGNRLAHSYAILIHCTELYASIVDASLGRDVIMTHFTEHIIEKGVQPYYKERRKNNTCF